MSTRVSCEYSCRAMVPFLPTLPPLATPSAPAPQPRLAPPAPDGTVNKLMQPGATALPLLHRYVAGVRMRLSSPSQLHLFYMRELQ